MVTRKKAETNGAVLETTHEEIKEHMGDPDAQTGIYAEPTLEEREKMLDQSQEMGLYDTPLSSDEKEVQMKTISYESKNPANLSKPIEYYAKTPMMLLVEALSKARAEFDAVTKNAANPYFKSKYADLSEVLGAITPALSANGLVVVQPIEQTETGLLLRTQLHHVGGGVIESTFAIPENKDIQKLGSAITYIRRYSLSALFGVAPQDDDGNAAAGKQVNNDDSLEQCVEYFAKFEQCKSLSELKTLWTDLNKNNPNVAKALTKVKDARKDALMAAEQAE